MKSVDALEIREDEVCLTAIRAQGAGGQHVNKVSSAIHLRYDIAGSSLPEAVKARLFALRDNRISLSGVLIIKAQQYRSQDQNRLDALTRLYELVNSVALPPKIRRATRPTHGAVQRRLETKNLRSQTKTLRSRVND